MARELEVVPWESGVNPEQYPLLYISSPTQRRIQPQRYLLREKTGTTIPLAHAAEKVFPPDMTHITTMIYICPRQVRRPAIALYTNQACGNMGCVFSDNDFSLSSGEAPFLPPADVDAHFAASAAGVIISMPLHVPTAAIHKLRTWHPYHMISYTHVPADVPLCGMPASS